VIQAADVCAYYEQNPAKPVLSNVSFSVSKGEIVSLLGPNGSGKSTLLCLLAGIAVKDLKKTGGVLRIDGKPVETYSRKNLSRKVSLLAQQEMYSWNYTVFDAVLMGRYAYSSSLESYSKEDYECTEQMLFELNILHLKDRSIFEISGGEYQRVMIARSLAQKTDILLLDEPFSHLDITSQHSLLSLIKKIAGQKNTTVIMSLHDINTAPLFSDSIILLKEGTIICKGETERVFTEEYLHKSYDAEFGFFIHPYYNVMQTYIL